jgi:hypothetical protein
VVVVVAPAAAELKEGRGLITAGRRDLSLAELAGSSAADLGKMR